MDIIKQFGQTVRSLRREKKLTQEELGELANLHFSYIGSIERGERNISLTNIYKICHALDFSVAEIFMMIETPSVIQEDFLSYIINFSRQDQDFFKELISLLQKWRVDSR